jgi:hypothetical protein
MNAVHQKATYGKLGSQTNCCLVYLDNAMSPKAILRAKSEIRTIHAWWSVENLVLQHTGGRENDFAIGITSDDDPGSRDSVG